MDKQAFNYAFDLGIREAAIRLEKRAFTDGSLVFKDPAEALKYQKAYTPEVREALLKSVLAAGVGGVAGGTAGYHLGNNSPKYHPLKEAKAKSGAVIGAALGAAIAGNAAAFKYMPEAREKALGSMMKQTSAV